MNREKTIEGVKKVINTYIEGTYNADREKLESAFHEKAVMNGYMGDELIITSPEAFIEDVTSKPSMKSQDVNYSTKLLEVNMVDKIATAVIYESGFFGSICFEDHFQLIFDEEWKIVSKLFITVEPRE